MNFIDKLERKFGRFGVPDLMRYVIGINVAGMILNLVVPGFYYQYLSLDMYQIFHGQVWRLFTFILNPIYGTGTGVDLFVNLFWFAIWSLVYYSIGQSLERVWGTFRFTLFMFSGWLFIILVTLIYYLAFSSSQAVLSFAMALGVTLDYLYTSLFLAFALMFPDLEFLVYFIIPVKAKWLAVLYVLLGGYTVVNAFSGRDYFTVALVLGAALNVVMFAVFGRGKPGVKRTFRQGKRKAQFKKKVHDAERASETMHRCAICGRTEKDAPGLEFRYCSKCAGNYEYCSDHLFTHEHVR